MTAIQFVVATLLALLCLIASSRADSVVVFNEIMYHPLTNEAQLEWVELQNKLGDRGLQIIGVSMDDGPEPVRDFYRQFKINYPVVMGNAKIGELYGGVLGLPIAFVIGRDGRIYSKHIGATDISSLEREIEAQLQVQEPSSGKSMSHDTH